VLAKDVPYTAKIEELYRRNTRTGNQVGYRLSVSLKGDAPVGTHKHNMYLKTNDPTNALVPVLIESSVQSLVQVSPSQLDLGAIKTDAKLIRRVVVRGSKPFTIKGVDGTGGGVELGGELPAREATAHFLTFECRATKEGAFRHKLEIRTSLPGHAGERSNRGNREQIGMGHGLDDSRRIIRLRFDLSNPCPILHAETVHSRSPVPKRSPARSFRPGAVSTVPLTRMSPARMRIFACPRCRRGRPPSPPGPR